MNTKPVRIVATPDEPYVYSCFTEYPAKCQKPGFEIEYMHTVFSAMLNLAVEFVSVENFDDARTALDLGQADVMGISTSIDRSYLRNYYTSPIAHWDNIGLIVKETMKENRDFLSIFQSFTYQLWLSLVSTTFATIALLSLVHLLNRRKFGNKKTLLFSNTLNKFWFVCVNVILNLYSNSFAVDMVMSHKTAMAPFEDLNDLGEKLVAGECKLVTLKIYEHEIDFHETFINPPIDEGHENQKWKTYFSKAFVENPPLYLSDRFKLTEMIQNNVCVVGVDYVMLSPFYQSRFCHIKVRQFPELKPISYVYYYTNNELTTNLSVILSPAIQAYPKYLAKKYFQANSMTLCDDVFDESTEMLPLEQFQGVFGLFISMLLMLIVCNLANAAFLSTRNRGLTSKF